MGGILVHVCGQEVLHGGRVQHGGAGSVGLNGVGCCRPERGRLGSRREIEVEGLGGWYLGLLVFGPGVLTLIWRHDLRLDLLLRLIVLVQDDQLTE